MASIDNIVQITITKDTATVDRVGFGIPGILTFHTRFPELARTYANLQEMTDDGFLSTDYAFQVATVLFSQNPRPASVVVGRRVSPSTRKVKITPKTPLLASTPYDVVINGNTMAFTTDADPVVTEITAGITAAIDGGASNVNATDNTTDVDVEAADAPGGTPTAGPPFGITFDPLLWEIDDITPDPGLAADLNSFRATNDTWYGLIADVFGGAEITVLVTAIEAAPKIYAADSQDSDIIDSGSGDIASTLKASAFERTFVCYHPATGTQLFGTGWLGKQLPTDPGSTTWKFKTLAGVAVYFLGGGDQTNIDGKNGNHYQEVAGLNITAEGTVASGEFIDIVRFLDWLIARIKEQVFRTFAVNPKIPFTDLGIQTIVNDVEGVLKEGANRGGIDPEGEQPILVTAPRAADVPTADKVGRTLPDIKFTATLAGAVHKAIIDGRVVV